jgi:hypothetical protein
MALSLYDIEKGAIVCETDMLDRAGNPTAKREHRYGVIVRVETQAGTDFVEHTNGSTISRIWVDFRDGKKPVVVPGACLALYKKAEVAAMERLREPGPSVVFDARPEKQDPGNLQNSPAFNPANVNVKVPTKS